MKISEAKTAQKAFVDDGVLRIVTKEEGNKITEFAITYKGIHKTFAVKNFNILAAWKQVEKFISETK